MTANRTWTVRILTATLIVLAWLALTCISCMRADDGVVGVANPRTGDKTLGKLATSTEAAQSGFFNVNWIDAVGAGGVGVGGGIALWLFAAAWGRRQERMETQHADEQETRRHGDALAAMDRVIKILGDVAMELAKRQCQCERRAA